MSKKWERLGSLALFKQRVEEKQNSEPKPDIFRLKIDPVSYPTRGEQVR